MNRFNILKEFYLQPRQVKNIFYELESLGRNKPPTWQVSVFLLYEFVLFQLSIDDSFEFEQP